MTAYEAHRIFQTIVLHCQGRHSVRNGLVKIPEQTFKVKYPVRIYDHFAKRFPAPTQLRGYVISSLIADQALSNIRELYSRETYFNRKYDKNVKRKQTFVKYFCEEFEEILNALDKTNFRLSDWLYGGGILSWYVKGKINIDTFTALESIFKFLEKGEKNNEVFNKFHLTFVEQYGKLKEIHEGQIENCKKFIETEVTERKQQRRTQDGYFTGRI